ncbi:DUF6993 domain-containing protein [Microcella frigidaquae]|uniref:DUF6993 domain-containing protein n=1 Tax=Microcella frigidaquae TaxID=424758 RepID=A0A840XF87_9MICO|nr:hypothetical protein [Microcella frigidaquae]MBB5617172.1 hypothetical protein [Microcella frigidaquae]NHN45128.1 hypothetical protein [Microcella frigidaquae]
MRKRSGASVGGMIALAAALVLGLVAGCAPAAPLPTPTITPSVTATPTPTATPDPELVEGGTAGQNRPYFVFVLTRLVEENPSPSSKRLLRTLVEAGFDREAIEITQDRTRIDAPADSILIGVLIDGQCLLGQVIDGEVVTELAEVLGTGRCLVGRTASLD